MYTQFTGQFLKGMLRRTARNPWSTDDVVHGQEVTFGESSQFSNSLWMKNVDDTTNESVCPPPRFSLMTGDEREDDIRKWCPRCPDSPGNTLSVCRKNNPVFRPYGRSLLGG